MRFPSFLVASFLGVALPALAGTPTTTPAPRPADWHMNVTVMQACTCPVLCQAVVDREPVGDEGSYMDPAHYCRFNCAYLVNRGHYGSVVLDGARFWFAGDFGKDPSKGEAEWAVLTFDVGTSASQREAIRKIVARLYPMRWRSLTTAEGKIQWTPGREVAWAALDGGETAEIRLKRFPGATKDPVVIHNVRYFGAAHNDGLILMPNVVQALRKGDNTFESRGTAGLMTTLDMDAKDATGPTALR